MLGNRKGKTEGKRKKPLLSLERPVHKFILLLARREDEEVKEDAKE